jgi:hypothetical protein
MSWDKQLPNCFSNSLLFVSHPLEEDRAFEWLVDLRRRGISWEAVREQVVQYLKSKKAQPQHIESQLKDVERHMRPWLLD